MERKQQEATSLNNIPKDVKPLYILYKNSYVEAVREERNKKGKWEYGYDHDTDVVCISKTGKVGEIYVIEGLKIGLPLYEKELIELDTTWWTRKSPPEELSRIKTKAQWDAKPSAFQNKYIDYINHQYDLRFNGGFFRNKYIPTYITGSYWMYLQWSRIDVGYPEYREANRILFIYWEACKADSRCMGMIYLKIRRSGASFMGSSEMNNIGTVTANSLLGLMSKTGTDAKSLFTKKVMKIYKNYPFFFKPIQSGMTDPKTEAVFDVPAEKITRKNIDKVGEEDVEGLNTVMDWRNTANDTYDSEKLKFLMLDEYGKLKKPNDISIHYEIVKECLVTGLTKVGKAFVISTCGKQNEGGKEYKELYYRSNPSERDDNNETNSGLYKLFIPHEWNYEGTIDRHGMPVFYFDPSNKKKDCNGKYITKGAIDYWNNKVKAYKNDTTALNSFYRQYPRKEEHAFRADNEDGLFNKTKIYEEIEYNDSMVKERILHRGNFMWVNNEPDTKVKFVHSDDGRFLISDIIPEELQNNYRTNSNGDKFPLNKDIGAFGCDPYDISKTSYGSGSKAGLHGKTGFHMASGFPTNKFFLEYIERPQKAEIFFEDVINCLVFHGMQVLCESNNKRLLYELKNRGYRGFSMNRPDRNKNKLSAIERELGGMPSNSDDVRMAHATAIESYIEDYIGYAREDSPRPIEDIGNMPFNRTLEDWITFNIEKRTKNDASISSGLAIMAVNRMLYQKHKSSNDKTITVNLSKIY